MTASVSVLFVPLVDVHPNPRNPRRHYGDMTDLVASIKARGVIQPCLAEPREAGGVQLLAGHRRLRASRLAGRETLPVVLVGERNSETRLVTALTENLHREPLSPMDEARACAQLASIGHSRAAVARVLQRSQSWVAERESLLDLPESVQDQVGRGGLTIAEAVKLARQRTAVVGARAPQTFHRGHPQAADASARCNAAGHPPKGRAGGGACTACWEAAIRADERAALTQ